MLKSLALNGVGPARHLEFGPLADRLNLITGDNGLGKSFLLDVSWWALTGTWPEYVAVGRRPDASLTVAFDGAKGVITERCPWLPEMTGWKRKGRPANPALVIYGRSGGRFSIWDPARNGLNYTTRDGRTLETTPAFHFSETEVWNGLMDRRTENGPLLCRGLIDDWTRWQSSGNQSFDLLEKLLSAISSGPDEVMKPGKPVRTFPQDIRDIPTIQMPYGEDVPVLFASAGMQRMLQLAYLLTWAFSEHAVVTSTRGIQMASQIVLLMDEPETHLHPRWQRMILPGLLRAIGEWQRQAPHVQIIATTHAPLVLASVEPLFDPAIDALWKLDLAGTDVRLERDVWHQRGDANAWLTSDVFDLASARSVEAEKAIEEAKTLLRSQTPALTTLLALNQRLGALLGDLDPFWVRWRYFVEQVEGQHR